MAAAWRCPYSDLRRGFQVLVASPSRFLSALATMDNAAWCPPPSSPGPAPSAGLLDRTESPSPSVLGRPHLHFSPSPPPGSAWRRRRLAVEARSFRPRCGRDREFASVANPDRLATKRHLYIVVDDHKKEYSIHKLDLDADSSSSGTLQRLRGQPVVRAGPPNIATPAQFTSLGSCIIAIGPILNPRTVFPQGDGSNGVTLIYDTNTATMLTAAPLLPRALTNGYNLAVAVRNRLYLIERWTDGFNWSGHVPYYNGGMHCLAANRGDDDEDCLTATDRRRDSNWDWRRLPGSSSGFSWSWGKRPPKIQFDAETIIAHAVHPRGRTIFVSVAVSGYPYGPRTYSYGTASGKFRCCGDWILPFKGQAHYDLELDAWVGLHHLPPIEGGLDPVVADGYLCACGVTSAAASRRRPPEWKLGGEKLFHEEDPDWTHMDAMLVYMGEGSMYCLVERLQPKGEGPLLNMYRLRLTTFGVKYGDDGELVTLARRPAGFYEVLSYSSGQFDVQAFYM